MISHCVSVISFVAFDQILADAVKLNSDASQGAQRDRAIQEG
jgi:hypothetical protein